MTEYKVKIITAILEHPNPEQAILIASNIIFDYLKQQESSQQPSANCQNSTYHMNQAY